ncbi:MAG: polyprenyl synthetase family protein [Candidatus Pacebacteria bacterium]|nr:polyprenyl synthetase family protein [Candidatus Paceibacterota bacterium]
MSSLTLFKEKFEPQYHALVTHYVHDFFSERISHAQPEIIEYMCSGKRIRPFLIWIMAGMPDIYDGPIACAGYAVELFHAMALIHDDIIDESSMRRGAPTPHHTLTKHTNHDRHIGESLALLWGDYILMKSYTHIHELPLHVQKTFSRMYEVTVHGQVHDVMNSILPFNRVSVSDIERVHTLKTGLYTFALPMRIGAELSNDLIDQSENVLQDIERLGLRIGTLFQLRDDIIDMLPASNKEQWKDIREGTVTWVSGYVRTHHVHLYDQLVAYKADPRPEAFTALTEQLALISWQDVFPKKLQILLPPSTKI